MTTALVTGASAGLGAQFATQLAARGDDLVLVARDAERLAALAASLRQTCGVGVEVLAADLADRDHVQRVADRLSRPDAPVDLLVNNAGFGLATGFVDGDLAQEERALDVMCRAVLVLCHAAGRAMSARGGGAILNVSSVAGFAATGTYSAAKAWVTTFSQGLAVELAPRGVTVTALCPGFTHTEFHDRAHLSMSRLPAAAWLDADDVVETALADLRRGRTVSVPGAHYKALVGLLHVLPARLVTRASIAVGRRWARTRPLR